MATSHVLRLGSDGMIRNDQPQQRWWGISSLNAFGPYKELMNSLLIVRRSARWRRDITSSHQPPLITAGWCEACRQNNSECNYAACAKFNLTLNYVGEKQTAWDENAERQHDSNRRGMTTIRVCVCDIPRWCHTATTNALHVLHAANTTPQPLHASQCPNDNFKIAIHV